MQGNPTLAPLPSILPFRAREKSGLEVAGGVGRHVVFFQLLKKNARVCAFECSSSRIEHSRGVRQAVTEGEFVDGHQSEGQKSILSRVGSMEVQ